MTPAKKLSLCSAIVLGFFIVSLFFHYIQGIYLGASYPFSTYLFFPGDALGDFHGLCEMLARFDPFHTTYNGFGNNYPPFTYLSIAPFTAMGFQTGVIVYFAVSFVGFLLFMWTIFRSAGPLTDTGLLNFLILGALTYPLHFSLDRSNVENLCFLFTAAFLVTWRSKRETLAAVLLGTAAAIKVIPALFAVIFLRERRFRPILIAAFVALGCTALAMVLFHVSPAELLSIYRASAPSFQEFALHPFSPVQHSVSLLAALRAWTVLVTPEKGINPAWIASTVSTYGNLSPVLFFLIIGAAFTPWTETWEKLLLVVAATLLVPPISFDYKLLHLFIPFALFIANDKSTKRDRTYTILFALLFSAKGFWVIYADVTISVIVNAVALSLMSAMIIKTAAGRRRASLA